MKKDVVLIGGAHIDIAGKPKHKLHKGEKNHGNVTFTAGGVAYNVAYNLSLLGIRPKLISLLCDDGNSQIIKDACKDNGIDIKDSIILRGESTPKYLYIVDYDGDTSIGISDIELYEKITPEFLQTKIDLINSYKVCFIDANLSHRSLEYLFENVKIPTMIDPVSVDHCAKLVDIIHMAHTIKPNDKEIEALCKIAPTNEDSLKKAKDYFIAKGVKEVFFSLGEDGLLYGDKNCEHHIKHRVQDINNTNGAGDAMMAGIVYGRINDFSIDKTAKLGVAASAITLRAQSAKEKDMTVENIEKEMEKF